MAKQILVWKRADGSVATTNMQHMDAETFEINKVMLIAAAPLQRAYDGLTHAGDIDETERPERKHEHYFDAFVWDDATKRVNADMSRSRALKLNWLRSARNEELVKLDAEQMKAGTDVVKIDAINAKKQKLRDMPQLIAPTLDACADLTALDAVTMAQFKSEHGL